VATRRDRRILRSTVSAEAKICDYRARYYDSTIGRFLREDPLRYRGGSTNFYSYVQNKVTNSKDPRGLWTLNLGGNINFQGGPINIQFSGGFVIGSDATIGIYKTVGGGVGIGAQTSLSLTAGLSTARSICGFGGPFVEVGENAGLGATEGVSLLSGLDEDGITPVGGGSISGGIGAGADVYAVVTVTTITPLIGRSCGCP
jgi:RHS repeat-associated protein